MLESATANTAVHPPSLPLVTGKRTVETPHGLKGEGRKGYPLYDRLEVMGILGIGT